MLDRVEAIAGSSIGALNAVFAGTAGYKKRWRKSGIRLHRIRF